MIALAEAALCVNCETVFALTPGPSATTACPSCGSPHIGPLPGQSRRPRLLAVVTASAHQPLVTARCTNPDCGWGECEALALTASLARMHAVATGHAVHLVDDPTRLCRCGRPIEPAPANEVPPLRDDLCRGCEEEAA